ncbi:MAG: amino acid ABC transporter substrate-binding protein [Mycobacterium sp.]
MEIETYRRPRRFKRMLSVLAVSTLLTAGCGSGSGGDTPIKIGGTLGLTGSLAAPASEYQAVYDAWAGEVNAKGGLLGRKVELVIRNDNSTAATAATLYQSLLTRDRVDLVLAPYATFVGAAVVPIVKSSGKLLFNGGFTDTGLNDAAEGAMISAYPYQPQDYTRGVFEAIASLPPAQRPQRVGILTNNNPFTLADRDGYNGQGGARGYARQAGLPVVFDETYGTDTTDFSAAINKARAAGADLFLILGLPEDSGTVLKTADTLGFEPKLLCACGSQVLTLPNWSELGPATERVLGTTVTWPTLNYPGLDVLQRLASERNEKVIPAYAAVAYASLQIVQQAVEGAKTLDQDKLREYIYGHSFETAVGTVKFAANGTADFQQVVLQSVGGQVRPVWPAAVAEAALELTPGT